MRMQEQAISVVACRGGGKTTFLGALKAACPRAFASGISLEFPDPGTQRYLRRVVEDLLSGEFPAATFQDVTKIEMTAALPAYADHRFQLVFHGIPWRSCAGSATATPGVMTRAFRARR